MKNPVQILILLILGLLLAACSAVASEPGTAPIIDSEPESAPLTKVSVALDWFPWSNHSGLFIAQERGYFEEQGLKVNIYVPGDPTTVVRIPTLLADTQAEANRQTENLMSLARAYYAGRVGIGSTDAGAASPDATEEVNLFGTAEEVVDKIEVLRDHFSTDEIMFEVNWTSAGPREVVMNTMRILTEKVIPKFK